MRVDKWLWSVRLFKTRQHATDACRLQRVHTGGQACRPSRALKIGDHLTIHYPDHTRTVEVTALPAQRLGPPLVPHHLIDHTPPAEYEKAERHRAEARLNHATMPPTKPTKRDRRHLTTFLAEIHRTNELSQDPSDGDHLNVTNEPDDPDDS